MKVTVNVSSGTREIVAGACGFLAVVGCFGLLLAETLHFPIDSFAYRLVDHTIFIGALLGLVLAFMVAEEPRDPHRGSRTLTIVIAAGAGLTTLAAAVVYHRGFPTYPMLTAFTVGLASAMMVLILSASSSADVQQTMPGRRPVRASLLFLLIAGATIVLRLVAPGTTVLKWVLTPLFFMMMPGLGLGSLLLPAETDWMERLIWAPVLSVCYQVVVLMWMNTLGLTVSVPTIFVLAGATTLLSMVGATLRHDELPL